MKSEKREQKRRKRKYAPAGGTLGSVRKKLLVTRGFHGTAKRLTRALKRSPRAKLATHNS